MAGKIKKYTSEMEEGILAISPIIFDSPETRSRLLKATMRPDRMRQRPTVKVKTFAVLPGSAGADELEDLLAGLPNEMYLIQ